VVNFKDGLLLSDVQVAKRRFAREQLRLLDAAASQEAAV